jgi:predicted nucleic-acid-binding Zn-ribbon protein
MTCDACQAPLASDALFCSTCGAQVQAAATGPTQRLAAPAEPDPHDEQTSTGSCPKCGSPNIIPNARLYPDKKHIGELQVVQYERPDLLWEYGDHAIGALRAWICADCGYTELYTNNAGRLFEVFSKARAQRRNRP